MGFHRGPKVITNGLVLSLDAGNTKSYPGSGTAWADKSGFGNNGTLTNGPTFNSGNGGSLVFDGVDDYVTIPDSTTLRGFTGLTISSWVNKKTKDIKVIGKWDGSAVGVNYILRETSGILQFYTWTTVGFAGGNIGINPTSGWNLYTATWDGTTMKAYKNSIVGSTTYSQSGTIDKTGDALLIGNEYDLSLNSDANISIVQIYNRALTAQEIQQNYNATKSRYEL